MADQADADGIWGSASAKQIRALGNVEKVRLFAIYSPYTDLG